MKKNFTVQFVKEHAGCYRNEEGKLKRTFEENNKTCFEEEVCDVTLGEILASTIPVKDKYWFIANNALTMEEKRAIAIMALDLFLSTFVEEFPDDAKNAETYINIAKNYVNDKASYNELRSAWLQAREMSSAHGWWVLDSVYYRCASANVSFGFSDPYYLLAYLAGYDSIKEQLFAEVVKFCQ